MGGGGGDDGIIWNSLGTMNPPPTSRSSCFMYDWYLVGPALDALQERKLAFWTPMMRSFGKLGNFMLKMCVCQSRLVGLWFLND